MKPTKITSAAWLCVATSLAVPAYAGAASPKAEKPNVILILLDDVGYSDFGCYGSEIETPNIDRLAEQGLRYRTFYNSARSAPTRASLMTGLYPHQVGIGALNEVPGYPNYQAYVNEQNVFIPEALREAGYHSVMTGKWHLGYFKGVTPVTRGFDRSLNAPAGGYYFYNDPFKKQDGTPMSKNNLYRNDVALEFDSPELPPQWYSTDLWTDAGLDYIDEAVERGEPFFWYLAHNAAHFPLQAPAETIDKYRGRYMEGWETVRNRRYERQLETGLFTPDEPLTPRNPRSPVWDTMSLEERTRRDLQMAIYAATIDEIDQSIGRVIEYLEEKDIFDNTLILILSDNGGNGEPGIDGRFVGKNPGAAGSRVWLGAAWADVANTPYYLYKHHAHEGGCSTPLVISYPNRIDASLRGTVDKNNFGHLVDIMPTILDVAGANYPAKRGSADVPPMEGVSLVPSLSGGKVVRTNPVIVEHEGNKMLRDGDWKAVQEYMEPDWMLYNMRQDPTEMVDLAEIHPLKLVDMVQEYERMANHTGVEPEIEFKTGPWYVPVHEYINKGLK